MFHALRPRLDPGHASLGKLEKHDDAVPLSKLRRGQLVGIGLGAKARFVRSKEPRRLGASGTSTPAGSAAVDLFRCRQPGCFVVSPRLAEALVALDPAVCPVRVGVVDVPGVDHAFVLTAPLVDALDLAASRARVDKFDGVPDAITRARSLVLRADAVPAARHVFRVPLLDDIWFVRDAACATLATFTGLELSDPAATSYGD